MKKSLLILVMLIFASQAMAATVDVSLHEVGVGNRTVDVNYVASANVSGFGLVISVDAGTIVSVTAAHEGESTSSGKGFGIFPESFSTYLDAASPDWGDANYTPVAPNSAPGATDTGIGYDTVILEMGALYEDGNAPDLSGVLCTIVVSADCNVTVTADATRGNVVMEDTTQAVFTGDEIPIPTPVICDYPACWDFATQCHGDIDDDQLVGQSDLVSFAGGWGAVYPAQKYKDNACSDADHDGLIGQSDLIEFAGNWGNASVAQDCPAVVVPNIYCP